MSGQLEENAEREIFRQMKTALSYCDMHSILNMELKPNNIHLDGKGKVKIMHFFLSDKVEPEQMLSQKCRAYPFGSLELFLGKHYDGT